MIDNIAIYHLNKMLSTQERPHLDSLVKADKEELVWCIRSMQKEISGFEERMKFFDKIKNIKILHEKKMTPEQFKTIRKDVGYTQSQLSDLIGIDSRTIRRYEAGMTIHKPVVILMELIEQGIFPIDYKRKVG